jgi:glycerol-3-phosphate acyltransferase PlsY
MLSTGPGPLLSIAIAYAVGCISFATVVARLRGMDIRAHGSGNPGATNVGRVLGRSWGVVVLLLDIAKGLVPVWLLRAPIGGWIDGFSIPPLVVDTEGRVLVLAAAVLGHVCPITARFRGGKGVATFIGGALALDPVLAAAAALTHLVFKKVLGYVSLASVALVWALPVSQLLARALGLEGRFLDGSGVLALLATLVTLRHLDNFRRIREGNEDRYDERAERPAAPPTSRADRTS